jgi:SAM-dependent methyltransferase
MNGNFASINSSKANFDEIYRLADPRGYFSVLGSLDYMIPDLAEPIVRQLLAARAKRYDETPVVLDVGCSYGINAAVQRFPVSFNTLRNRYARGEMAAVEPAELARLDRNFYASWPQIAAARFIGLDVSEPAVRYACEVGLLEAGITNDLERQTLSPAEAALLRPVNVILSTGCVGYVTERTYRKLLDAVESPPWIISFVLRMFPYDTLAGTLAEYGLVTERLAGAAFVQRRFRDVEEFTKTLSQLAERGIDTAGFESEGRFQAELFVSRPAADVQAAPLGELVTVTSGRNRPVGTRYVQVETDGVTRIALEP